MRHRLLAAALVLFALHGNGAIAIEEPAYEIVRTDEVIVPLR